MVGFDGHRCDRGRGVEGDGELDLLYLPQREFEGIDRGFGLQRQGLPREPHRQSLLRGLDEGRYRVGIPTLSILVGRLDVHELHFRRSRLGRGSLGLPFRVLRGVCRLI
jgi:hypothetical protein